MKAPYHHIALGVASLLLAACDRNSRKPEPQVKQNAVVETGETPKKTASEAERHANQHDNMVHIVDFGEYSTSNTNATQMRDYNWTFEKETANIKIGTNNGFGFHFSLPESQTSDIVSVTATLIGAFGPPGVTGYEAQMACPVIENNGHRVGEMIFPCVDSLPYGTVSQRRAGDYTIRIKLGESVVEKTFTLSN